MQFFAQGSIVIIKSHTSLLFSGNVGYKGSALALIGNSFISLKNHAEHSGGAIYVKDYRVESFNKGDLPRCFFQIRDYYLTMSPDSSLEQLFIILENNTAQHAGSALYGGWVDYCQADMSLLHTVHGTEVFDTIFQIHNDNNDISGIIKSNLHLYVCQFNPQLHHHPLQYHNLPW